MDSPFLFVTCQSGMENLLKKEVAARLPDSRFSFSKRGLVIFKCQDQQWLNGKQGWVLGRSFGQSLQMVSTVEPENLPVPEESRLEDQSHSVGKSKRDSVRWNPKTFSQAVSVSWASEQAGRLIDRLVAICLARSASEGLYDRLHVWVRDGLNPAGQFQRSQANQPELEGLTVFCDLVSKGLVSAGCLCPESGWNRNAETGQKVLDVCVVSPTEFWVGEHHVHTMEQRWPGGILPTVPTENPVISRAYYKVREAVIWSQLPILPGMKVAEIGASPGGSCQWLLEQGCQVIGIDPAEIDPLVAEHPSFVHVQKRGREVKRRQLSGIRWLLSDANVAPKYILDTFEDLLQHPSVRPEALVLTLKLPDVALLDELDSWKTRIGSWGFEKIQCRQLVFDRQEICVVAQRK